MGSQNDYNRTTIVRWDCSHSFYLDHCATRPAFNFGAMTIFPGTETEMAMLSRIIEKNCECGITMPRYRRVCPAHSLYLITQEELNELVFTRWRFRKERIDRNAKPD